MKQLHCSQQLGTASATFADSDDERFTSEHLEVVATIDYPEAHLQIRHVVWVYPDSPGTRVHRRSAPGDGGPQAEFHRRPEAAPGSAVRTQHPSKAKQYQLHLKFLPGRPPVCSPPSITISPFTSTYSTPRQYASGSSTVDPSSSSP